MLKSGETVEQGDRNASSEEETRTGGEGRGKENG